MPQADFEDSLSSDRLKTIQHAFQQSIAATSSSQPQPIHPHQDGLASQSVNASESLPDLPSTVPDSQAIANVEQILQEIPDASVQQVMSALKKMSSQGAAPHDTQPLTPDFVESYIKARQSERTVHEDETVYTNVTLHPGDGGYVDFSSYQQGGVLLEDEDESEPVEVDFSPTQSVPTRLSQFPESQRFKTPATVGKKRNYNGDVFESPALPRNPLIRNGEPTHGRMMGLSQAFAATQAPSSPLVNGLPSELRSDRPSPAFAIQLRPNTATDSSPMLARPLVPRRSTEPQTKYISMEESQALRDAQKRLELEDVDEDCSDTSFDETPITTRRLRAKRRRDEEAQRQFEAVARSNRAKAPRSSPVRSPQVAPAGSSSVLSPVNGYLHPNTTSPPLLPDDVTNASEEETDQEDEAELVSRRSGQMRLRAVPEEDKENAPQGAIQIPETAALHRIMSGFAADIEPSPSARHSIEAARSQLRSQRLEDGEPFVVANSQPSQLRRYANAGPRLVSSGEQTDFVPQSQYPSNSSPGRPPRFGAFVEEHARTSAQQKTLTMPSLLVAKSETRSSIAETAEDVGPAPSEKGQADEDEHEEEKEDEDEEPPRRTLRSQPAPQTLSSTIPESSSARLRGGISSSTDQRVKTSKSMTEFETAPTHPQSSANNHDSAPAALQSPTRGKRKRMTDIDAEESQPQSTAPDLGDLSPVLKDPEYRDIMGSSSPIRLRRNAKKRRLEASPLKAQPAANTLPVTSSPSDRQLGSTRNEGQDEQEPRTTQGETPPASSDEIRPSAFRRRGLHRPNPAAHTSIAKPIPVYGRTKKKLSSWDIQGSPEEPVVTISAARVTSLRKPASTLPFTEPRVNGHSVLSRAVSERSQTKEKSGTTPLATAARLSRAKARLTDVPEPSFSTPEAGPKSLSVPVVEVDSRSPPSREIIAPNQVLACFNGKSRAYYPAACLGISGTDTLRYQIQWDGYEPDEIDEWGLRSLDLRHGDIIKINLAGFPKIPHVIRGFKNKASKDESAVTDIRGYKVLLVAQKQRKSLPINSTISPEEIKEVPVSAIYLDSNMWNQMKDRSFTYIPPPTIALSTRPGFSTPMERPSTPSTPSSRSRRLAASTGLPATASLGIGSGRFANMCFAISYDSPDRKNELTSLITLNGGFVLSAGFHELFQPDTMMLKPQYSNLGFTALLADKHSRKEKYLQALALGLPCLSGKWLEACIASDYLADWQSYLLPAGESDELEGAVRSRVLPTYDTSKVRIADVLVSRPDVLNAEPVVFVLGRGKAEEKRRPYVFLTQALGAGHIEKVSDIRAAKVLLDEPSGREFKWIFVDDRDVETAGSLLNPKTGQKATRAAGVNVVGNEFVKQSLVFGRPLGTQQATVL